MQGLLRQGLAFSPKGLRLLAEQVSVCETELLPPWNQGTAKCLTSLYQG